MKLFDLLQHGLNTSDVYEDLIKHEGAGNFLVAGHLDEMDYYTPTDADKSVRNSILTKIMRKYYTYNTFSDDGLYFRNRVFWRLQEIMPKYKAKYDLVRSQDELIELIRTGYVSEMQKDQSIKDNGYYTNTGNSSNRVDRNSGETIKNLGTQEIEDSGENYASDYPQIVVDDDTDYNAAGAKSKASSVRTDNLQERVDRDGFDVTSYNQNLRHDSHDERENDHHERRVHNWTPSEIALAREKLAKLILNIEKEIVEEMGKCFKNVVDLEECSGINNQGFFGRFGGLPPFVPDGPDNCHTYDDELTIQLMELTALLNTLKQQVEGIDLTDEDLEYIRETIPGMEQDITDLKAQILALQASLAVLATRLLPEVTDADEGKWLIVKLVNDIAFWGAESIENTSEVRF